MPVQPTILIRSVNAHDIADHAIDGRLQSAFGRLVSEPPPTSEASNRRDVAKPPLPPCPEGQRLGSQEGPLGAERKPRLGDASLVLKWASRHHTEPEHDQVLRMQHTASNGKYCSLSSAALRNGHGWRDTEQCV